MTMVPSNPSELLAMDEDQLIPVIAAMRSPMMRTMVAPMLRAVARTNGVENIVDVIMSDDLSNEQVARLIAIWKREKDNGQEAALRALSTDDLIGPIYPELIVRLRR